MAGEDFQAALSEQERSEGAAPPIMFTLKGETFACRPVRLSPWTVLKLQAIDDRNITKTAEAFVHFFERIIRPEDWDRWETMAEDPDDPPTDEELMGAVGEILEAYTANPPKRSTVSAVGPSPTGRSSTRTGSKPEGPVRAVPSSRAQTVQQTAAQTG